MRLFNLKEEYKENERVLLAQVINYFNKKYEIKMIEKKLFCGTFTFYSIHLKRINIDKDFLDPILIDNKKYINKLNNNDCNYEKFSELESNLEGSTSNTFKKNSFLIKYQNSSSKIISSSKSFKKIYILLIIIIVLISIFSISLFVYNVKEFENYIEKSDIFDGFSFIKYKLILIFINIQYYAFNTYRSFSNSSSLYKDRLSYSKNSLINDLQSLNSFLDKFLTVDYSSSFFFKSVSSQTHKIFYLTDNNEISYNNYTIYQALDIYLSQSNEFISDDRNIQDLSIFYETGIKKNSNSVKLRQLYFILENYFNTFKDLFENIYINSVNDCSNYLENNRFWFKIQSIIFGIVLLIILSILIIIWINVYKFDNLLVKFYSDLNKQIIIDSIYALMIKGDIEINKLESENIYKLSTKSVNKNIDRKVILKTSNDKIYLNKINTSYENLLNDEINKSKNQSVTIHNTESIYLSTQENLINSNNHLGNFKLNIEVNNLSKTENNIVSDKNIHTRYPFDSFYIKKFFKAFFFMLGLSYFYLIQSFVLSLTNDAIDNYMIHHGTLNSQSMINNLMVSSFLMSLSTNAPILEENNTEAFSNYFNLANKYGHNFSSFTQDYAPYNTRIQPQIIAYNSLNFCGFFFNKTNIENDVYNPSLNITDCLNDSIKNGLNIYISNSKNQLKNTYEIFKQKYNKSKSFQIETMEASILQKSQIFLNFYLRKYREDIMILMKDNYTSSIAFSLILIKVCLGIFLFHLVIYIYYLKFYYSKYIHFHLDKKRILISILPKEKNSVITDKINRMMTKYF